MKEIFVTYSWDGKEHQEKVISFTDYLRQQGFHAEIDVKLTQEESAINFMKMMHKSIKVYERIIIVLSKGYKEKAEVFEKGVGVEYALILADIDENPKKYILVTLEPMSGNMIPLGMKNREIIDMTIPGNKERLHHKLLDVPVYKFSDVAESKPVVATKEIAPFEPVIELPQVHIDGFIIGTPLSSTLYRRIKELRVPCRASIKNTGKKVIEDTALEILMPQNILEEALEYGIIGDNIVITFPIKKLFPGQFYQTPEFHLKLKNNNTSVINKVITVRIYTDAGPIEENYILKEIIKFDDSLMNINPKPLTEDMFLPINYM